MALSLSPSRVTVLPREKEGDVSGDVDCRLVGLSPVAIPANGRFNSTLEGTFLRSIFVGGECDVRVWGEGASNS